MNMNKELRNEEATLDPKPILTNCKNVIIKNIINRKFDKLILMYIERE